MDPRTGDFVTDEEYKQLLPEERRRFSVQLQGRLEDMQAIADAVKESGSAKRRRKAVERREYWENRE